jgi:DNA-binding transcriptional MerR regulator
MKDKRYSISQIQQIIDISPNDLQKLIRKNSTRLQVQTCELPDGSQEKFLDEESFKKLIFIKQLETGIKLSVEEVCELMQEKKLGNENELDETAAQFNEYANFDRYIDSVEEEVKLLRTQMTRMVIKYDHCIKELNLSRAKNIALEKEIKKHQNREAALMGELRKTATATFEEEIIKTDLN